MIFWIIQILKPIWGARAGNETLEPPSCSSRQAARAFKPLDPPEQLDSLEPLESSLRRSRPLEL